MSNDVITRTVKFKVKDSHSEQMHFAISALKGVFEQYKFKPNVQYEVQVILGPDAPK